jgi:uncharacterized protein (TIRG00374 family)
MLAAVLWTAWQQRAVLDGVHVQGRLIFLAAGAATASFALRILRWHLFVRALGGRITLVTSARTQIIGFGFSMTPGRAGELVKCALLERQGGLPATTSVPVLLLERALDGLAFLVLALAALPFTPAANLYMPVMQRARLWAGLALAVAGLAAVAAIAVRIAARRGSGPRLPLRFRSGIAELRRAAGALLRPGVLASALACSLAARSADAIAVWVVMAALGAPQPFAVAALVLGMGGFIGGASLIPAGAGAVEASMASLWLAFDVGVAQALAGTLLARALTLWGWVILGLLLGAATQWPAAAVRAGGRRMGVPSWRSYRPRLGRWRGR